MAQSKCKQYKALSWLLAAGGIPEVPCKYRHGESLLEEFGEVQAVMQFTRALSPGPRLEIACKSGEG